MLPKSCLWLSVSRWSARCYVDVVGLTGSAGPYLTAYTNCCFAIGQFISAGVLQGALNRDDAWGYKIPFTVQLIWPPFLLLAGWFMPER